MLRSSSLNTVGLSALLVWAPWSVQSIDGWLKGRHGEFLRAPLEERVILASSSSSDSVARFARVGSVTQYLLLLKNGDAVEVELSPLIPPLDWADLPPIYGASRGRASTALVIDDPSRWGSWESSHGAHSLAFRRILRLQDRLPTSLSWVYVGTDFVSYGVGSSGDMAASLGMTTVEVDLAPDHPSDPQRQRLVVPQGDDLRLEELVGVAREARIRGDLALAVCTDSKSGVRYIVTKESLSWSGGKPPRAGTRKFCDEAATRRRLEFARRQGIVRSSERALLAAPVLELALLRAATVLPRTSSARTFGRHPRLYCLEH